MTAMTRITVLSLLLFGLAGFLIAGERPAPKVPQVTTVAAPEGCKPVIAKTDAQGTIHLVCNSEAGPQYVKSTDGGKTLTKPVLMVDQASKKPGLVFDVWDMVVSPDGKVHVALGTNAWKLKLPKAEWGFFYTSLEPGKTAFSPVRNINGRPSEGFSLAVNEHGDVTACWLADKLFANVSHDAGKTFGPTLEIDPAFNPCNCCTTSCTYGADGKVAVLYREETNNERDMFLVLWDQAGNKSSRTRVSSVLWKIDACPMSYYGIAAKGDGYAAVWPTEGRNYFAELDRAGKPRTPQEIKTPGMTGMRTGMLTLNGAAGSTLVAWKKDSQLGWQLYDDHAKPVGSPGMVPSAGSGAAGIVDKSGSFVLFQ
jgi:hypothetical protein